MFEEIESFGYEKERVLEDGDGSGRGDGYVYGHGSGYLDG